MARRGPLGPGPRQPRAIDDERVALLIKSTPHMKPANGSTHWRVRTVAAETGIAKTIVRCHFERFGTARTRRHGAGGFKAASS